MDTFELIKTLRSIRKFTDETVSDEMIDRIIEAGSWAPSGLNNQAWKFAAIRDSDLKTKISELTHYSKIVLNANVLITVFLGNDADDKNLLLLSIWKNNKLKRKVNNHHQRWWLLIKFFTHNVSPFFWYL
ncbi:MAG: hypothetical protein GY781_13885, partial [Gammaproteobacteria bacterium]|nr:hypothetical protein [Gammaproteobacteria bacterium]